MTTMQTTTKAPKVLGYETTSMDCTSRVQIARSCKSGRWFRRIQERHPRFGYRWTAWRSCEPQDESRLGTTYGYMMTINWRLPE